MFIYLIGVTSETAGYDRLKIGYSRSPKARRNTLQNASPYELEILGTWNTPEGAASFIEGRCHAALADFRLKGEWFSLSPRLAAAVIEHCVAYSLLDDFLTEALRLEALPRKWASLSREERAVEQGTSVRLFQMDPARAAAIDPMMAGILGYNDDGSLRDARA